MASTRDDRGTGAETGLASLGSGSGGGTGRAGGTAATGSGAPPPRESVFTRLYTGTGAFDIVGRTRTWYIALGLILVVCVGSIVFRGFNLGIDFTGGTSVQFPTSTSAPADPDAVRDVFTDVVGTEPAVVQSVGTGAAASIVIRSETLEPAQFIALRDVLFAEFAPPGPDGAPSVDAISSSDVSASWGGQITTQALIALLVFLVLVTIFLAFYFERSMAVGALVALVHDITITAGIYSLVGFEVTPATVIGLLTILGFSLYDTVVVFDKVKENTHNLLSLTRRSYPEAANLAINQVLTRSINTSLIAVLPVLGLMVIGVGLLGVGTLADLALVQIVGILAGVLSSVLLAVPVAVQLKMRDPRFQEQAERVRLRRRHAAEVASGASATPEPPEGRAAAAEAGRPVPAGAGAAARPGAAPRPGVRPDRSPRGAAATARPSGKRRR